MVTPTIMETGNDNPFGKFTAPSISSILSVRDQAIENGEIDNIGNIAPDLPPRAADDFALIAPNGSQTVSLLANDNDINGDSFSVTSVPAFTNAGNPITLIGDNVTIEADNIPNNETGYDWFRYKIEDSTGQTSTAVVHITVGTTDPTVAEDVFPASFRPPNILITLGIDHSEHVLCEH